MFNINIQKKQWLKALVIIRRLMVKFIGDYTKTNETKTNGLNHWRLYEDQRNENQRINSLATTSVIATQFIRGAYGRIP